MVIFHSYVSLEGNPHLHISRVRPGEIPGGVSEALWNRQGREFFGACGGGFSGAEVWMKVTSCTQIPQPRLLLWHWNSSILQQLAAVDPEGFCFRTCLVEGSQILIRFSWLGERIVQARIEDPQDSMMENVFRLSFLWLWSSRNSVGDAHDSDDQSQNLHPPKLRLLPLVLMLVPRVYHVMVQGLASNWVMISHPKKYGRWVYRGTECPWWGKASTISSGSI